MRVELQLRQGVDMGISAEMEVSEQVKEENGSEESFSLEKALEQLDGMIEKLSDREVPLEETFETYKAGMELLKKCEAQVDLIEKKVMVLNEEGDMDEL